MEEFQEFPKMLYKHPVDKTKEHKHLTVTNCEEQDAAFKNGYQIEPHVPQTEQQMDTIVVEAQGSGSERYEAGDWTQSQGEGLTDDTGPKTIIPVEQDSPKEILEFQHMNEKDNDEKIEE